MTRRESTETHLHGQLLAAKTAVEVADEAIQILGGYGYITEYEVERFYRDAKITEIYEGQKRFRRIRLHRH